MTRQTIALCLLALIAPIVTASPQYTAIDLYMFSPPPSARNFFLGAMGSAGQIGGHGTDAATGQVSHPLYQAGPGISVDLLPAGAKSGSVLGVSGMQQVGSVNIGPQASSNVAIVWSGTSQSTVVLQPASGYSSSYASGVGGTQEVGYGLATSGDTQALLWTGTAASVVNLNPAGFRESSAKGTDGVSQVGYAQTAIMSNSQAILWLGTAASAVNLHPSGWTQTFAEAVSGNEQVGRGVPGSSGNYHALVWHGTAASLIDLNPTNLTDTFRDSRAIATNGTTQVGLGYTNGFIGAHALAWTGSPDSAVDLQLLLPATYTGGSTAYAVNARGDIFGVASDASGAFHVIEWVAPEPVTGTAIAMLTLLSRARCRPVKQDM